MVRAGDLLIGMDGEFGCFEWRGGDALLNQRVCRLEGFSDELLPRFVYYGMNRHLKAIEDVTTFTTVKHLSSKQIAAIEFPVPPLAEQQRTVRILDDTIAEIAQGAANTSATVALSDELFASHLNREMESLAAIEPLVPLSRVLASQPRNGWSPPASSHTDDGGTPVLTLSAVTGFHYRSDKVKYTTAVPIETSHCWLSPGDLLITRSNTPKLVGHVAIYDGAPERVIYPDLIMRMRPDPMRLLTDFAYYWMRTERSRGYLTSKAGGASQTMSKITKAHVQNLPIAVPPLHAQAIAVERIDAISKVTSALVATQRYKSAQLDLLRASLVERAFSGGL